MPYISSAERIGIEKGLQEGRQEGLEEGLHQGLQTGAREAVLEVLEARFGAVPQEIQEIISAQSDLSILRRWHRQAITHATLAAFQDTLEDEPPSPR